ncbi:adenylate/guanylate cyclase domain-containing protein [Roseimaritima ulvae]|uniref:Adenylate cyclase 1 n=1 Tax=Roseimaritima ulvae TaxID=980254 RepID=A0A5B9R2M5_9BACT|nr:adenylate/guanylate cyclase domain-containing protein [Roseimaritima ulvae]QEG40553.1 Adenylate cyclase 1 [Roseimaritima ulvae]
MIHLTVICSGMSVATYELPEVEIGRQQDGEPPPFEMHTGKGVPRVIVAANANRYFPRKLLRLSVEENDLVVRNLHEHVDFEIDGVGTMAPGDVRSFSRPIRIQVSPSIALEVHNDIWSARTQHATRIDDRIESNDASAPMMSFTRMVTDRDIGGRSEAVVQLLRLVLQIREHAAGSDEFFHAATHAAAKALELDRAMVMMRRGEGWECVAEYPRPQADADTAVTRPFSQTLLCSMLLNGKTEFFEPTTAQGGDMALQSLVNLDRGVATPLIGEHHQVIGALCGDRIQQTLGSPPISALEATLLEVIAETVSSGLARRREEENRTRLEQFFTSRVADQLQDNPRLLEGHDATVTVLFCDIRGFSTITQRLGATKTILWINDVLTELSECVLQHDGVLVDYVGDELLAMWGAPGPQADHAQRAVAAAIDMLAKRRPLSDRWHDVVVEEFGFGIGLSTGQARVGNTGSQLKFKYGPLGSTVNIGSRFQGATKYFRVPALATERTVEAMAPASYRRLGQIQVVGIPEPLMAFEIGDNSAAEFAELKEQYEAALDAFEAQRFFEAARRLSSLLERFPKDAPTVLLLSRVVDQLARPGDQFSPVWKLEGK